MGRTYTTSGIQFNTGTVTSGTIQVTDSEGGTVLRTGLSIVEVKSLNIGTPDNTSGAINVIDSGNIYARLNVDDGLLMGAGKPIRLTGTTAPAAGGADTCALYVDAGGAGGKNRLMALFDTGAAVVLATEP